MPATRSSIVIKSPSSGMGCASATSSLDCARTAASSRETANVQGDVDMVSATDHGGHDRMTVGQHRQRVDAFRARRFKPAVGIGGKRGATGPRLYERVPAGRMSFGMEDMTIDGDRSLPQQHGWTSKEPRSNQDHPNPTGRTESVTPQRHAPRLGGWGHDMELGGGTEFS